MAEWLKAADCKSADEGLRRFESFSPHAAGVVQWQNPSLPSWWRGFDSHHPLRAENSLKCLRSAVVEHFLGKEEVAGSIPAVGSFLGSSKVNN